MVLKMKNLIDLSDWNDEDSCVVLKAQITDLSEWLAIEVAIHPDILKNGGAKPITFVPKLVGGQNGN